MFKEVLHFAYQGDILLGGPLLKNALKSTESIRNISLASVSVHKVFRTNRLPSFVPTNSDFLFLTLISKISTIA